MERIRPPGATQLQNYGPMEALQRFENNPCVRDEKSQSLVGCVEVLEEEDEEIEACTGCLLVSKAVVPLTGEG